jgi:hypothetical protein
VFIQLLLTALLLTSCSQQESPAPFKVIEITGRNEHDVIYRVKAPVNWAYIEPTSPVVDTTKSIIEFFITDDDQKIRITIHNFPADTIDQRTPPLAQITRWKAQFENLNQTTVSIKPQSFGGYQGYLFEGTGLLNNIPSMMIGWTLQLASEHFRALSRPLPKAMENRHREMRGDVTIKAVGPEKLMQKYHHEITTFARSFQLIDDIP